MTSPRSGRALTTSTDPRVCDDLGRWPLIIGLGLVVAMVTMFYVRPLLAHDWPIGDGGLFFAIIGDLRQSGFEPPAMLSYQSGVIPFVYPPLALYVGAGVEAIAGISRSDMMRFLPVTAAVACVVAIYLVGSEAAPSRRHALLAAAYFGTLLGLTDHLTSGGGLTRAVGLLLALLATWQGLRMYRLGRWRNVVGTAVLGGLALLAHPETGPFIGVALGSALLTRWRTRRAVAHSLAAVAGAALVLAPWAVMVLTRHGIEPLLAATGVVRRDPLDAVVAYMFLFLFALPLVGVLDIVGQVQQAMDRRSHLLTWRVGVFAFDLRHSPIAGAAPVSLLASHATLDILTPLAWSLAGARRPGGLDDVARARIRVAVAAVTVLLATVTAISAAEAAAERDGALTPGQRAAMAWVREHTPETAKVVVLATDVWGSDIVSEWFPALAGRASLTTSQGFEWVPDRFRAQWAAEAELRDCRVGPLGRAEVASQADCLSAWLRRHAQDDQVVVYLDGVIDGGGPPVGCCGGLALALEASGGYEVLWRGPGGSVLAPVTVDDSP